jgi:hypothetical protein
LADGLVPRDSSQAEKKVTVTKAEQIHRMAIIFTKKLFSIKLLTILMKIIVIL